jgi:hypothetical protein
MAKLTVHGTELYRYFSLRYHGLISVRSDGYALVKRPGSDWKLCLKRKRGRTLDDWATHWAKVYAKLKPWKKRVQTLPTLGDLEHWTFDGLCETTDGETYEPDYRGDAEHGPSWLIALGFI